MSNPPPTEAALPTHRICKDGSMQYDKPQQKKLQPLPVALKPPRSPVSPLSGSHYHSLEPHDGVSPLLSTSITSPQFPVAAINLHLPSCNQTLTTMSWSRLCFSPLWTGGPPPPTHQSSLSLSAFDSSHGPQQRAL